MEFLSILLIEDNPDIQRLIQSSLGKEWKVHISTNAESGLELLEKVNPSLILLDIMLPGLSGLEFCSLIKNNEKFKHIPVIVLSARVGTTARVNAYEIGASSYLEKPFEISELRSIIHSYTKLLFSSKESPYIYKDLTLRPLQRKLIVGERVLTLTPREFELMRTLMANSERVVTRQQFLEKWESVADDSSERTMDNFISSLRRKIKDSSVEIKTHYSVGYELRMKNVA